MFMIVCFRLQNQYSPSIEDISSINVSTGDNKESKILN